jgi:hypothetical protein
VTSLSELLRAVPGLVSPALLRVAAVLAGAVFGLVISRSTRFSSDVATGLGSAGIMAAVYSGFLARMIATGVFFAVLVRVSSAAAIAAAVGFSAALAASLAVQLVKTTIRGRGRAGRVA